MSSTTSESSSSSLPYGIADAAGPVALYGIARPKEGREEDFIAEVATIIDHARGGHGNQQYEVHALSDSPGVFVLYERWASGPDLLRHLQQPRVQTYLNRVAHILDGDFEGHWMHPIQF